MIHERPRLVRAALRALTLCTLSLALVRVQPGLGRAQEEPHSSLSVAYLRLAVHERPNDTEARFELVRGARAIGELAEARSVLAPLLEAAGAAGRRARALSVELEHQSWVAVPEAQKAAREQARARYLLALNRLRERELSLAELEQLALRLAQAGEQAQSASLRVRIALRGSGAPAEADIVAAEKALLAAGRVLEVAALYEQVAERSAAPRALSYALLALRHARSAAQPETAWAMFQRLRSSLGEQPRLLAVGLNLADDRADKQGAGQLIEQLLRLEPELSEWHVQMKQRALWNGNSARALREQLWLDSHGIKEEQRLDVRETARALSDLRLLATLEAKQPSASVLSKSELVAHMALREALGEPEAAYTALLRHLEAKPAADRELWSHRLALELALGKSEAAVESLRLMDARFGPDPARSEQRVNLLLRLGRVNEALALLEQSLDVRSYAEVARFSALAWSLGDLARAHSALRRLVTFSEASEADSLRLCSLLRLTQQKQELLAVALAGLLRFHTRDMFDIALDAALQLDEQAEISRLLALFDAPGQPFTGTARDFELRASYHQKLSYEARKAHDLPRAKQEQELARSDLTRALALAPERPELSRRERAQTRAELELALESGDKARLADAYARVGSNLTLSERVFVLHELGRGDAAAQAAKRALARTDLSREDRQALALAGEQLIARQPRYVGAAFEFSKISDLELMIGRAEFTYTWARFGVQGGVEYTQLSLDDSLAWQLKQTHELRPWTAGTFISARHQARLEFGVDTRDGPTPRPYLTLSDGMRLGARGATLTLTGAVNEVSNSSAGLRALGVQDQLAIQAVIPLSAAFYLSATAQGLLWSTRDRDLLGAGVNTNAAVAYHVLPAKSLFRYDLRLAARYAPSFPRTLPEGSTATRGDEPTSEWLVPADATWLGIGTTFAYGEIGAPPLSGRRVGLLADAAIGWLWPQAQLGYYAEVGAGVSPLGEDLLALKARVGNVVGTTPGSLTWGAALSYRSSLW